MTIGADGKEIPGTMPGSLAGWAKSVVLPKAPPQAEIPVTEVPGVLARGPGAYVSATVDAAQRDLGAGGAGVGGVTRAEPGLAAGVPDEMSQVDNSIRGFMLATELHDGLLSDGNTFKAPAAFYRPQGTDATPVGGAQGVKDYATAFGAGEDDGPARVNRAHEELGKVEAEKASALGKAYDEQASRDTQMAAQNQARRAQDESEMQFRQEKLDKATTFYTNDLADQGKFWTNPGNIIAAISFSLLPIFSNDPTVGVKLINQAVQQDMANRQTAAEGTLGALRSNLSGYHKMANDRQAGDMLAMSEAHRIAANEILRIGQKFESPISQSKMKVLYEDRMKQSALLRMEAHKSLLYAPAQRMDPGLHAARGQGYDGAWQAFGKKDVAPLGSAVKSSINGSPTTAGEKFTHHVDAATQAQMKVGGEGAAFRAALDGRVPGSGNLYLALKQSLNQQAMRLSHGDPNRFQEQKAKILAEAEDQIAKAPELTKLATRRAGIARVQRMIAGVQASESAAGRDPRAFLDGAQQYMDGDWVMRYRRLSKGLSTRGEPGSAKELDQMERDAKIRMGQAIAAQANAYALANSGTAVSAADKLRTGRVVDPDMPLDEISNWINMESGTQAETETAELARLSPVAGLSFMLKTGIGVPVKVPHRGRAAPIKEPAGWNPLPKGSDGTGQSVGVSKPGKLMSGGD